MTQPAVSKPSSYVYFPAHQGKVASGVCVTSSHRSLGSSTFITRIIREKHLSTISNSCQLLNFNHRKQNKKQLLRFNFFIAFLYFSMFYPYLS
uniref:Uncharacterized protein n=1 Tax=Ciona intestinalis TaxID=7719 RepID=H2XME4_CIOIN